ncbi:hypothetical protein [Telluribacter sp.]|jgi:hypothetical protein|uniref:hypothetical protein n=1 Tax=Telluribacter sp. TaxID=1978767 RepID=UPI002E1015A2|nr:hypothetical protein [Telluribacter sp.]
MKFVNVILFILVAALPLAAQDNYDPARALSSEELLLKKNPSNRAITKPGQRYLVLDASPRIGAFRRYRYFPGDDIRFKLKGEFKRRRENIHSITDSTFSIVIIDETARRMYYQPISLGQVKQIKQFQRIPWVTEGAFLFPIAGLVYAAADFFNPGIDNQRFTTDTRALAVGGGLIVTGILCYKISFPSYRINNRNRLKVLQTY